VNKPPGKTPDPSGWHHRRCWRPSRGTLVGLV